MKIFIRGRKNPNVCIDGSRAAQAGADLGNLLAADADVRAKDFLSGGDRPATDH